MRNASTLKDLAADPVLLELDGAPSGSFRIAVLSVGLARTLLHPHVAASFQLMLSSIRMQQRTFFSLWSEHAAQLQAGIRCAYGSVATAVWLRSTELACNARCTAARCAQTSKAGPFNLVRQVAKWRVAYGDLLNWQRARRQAAEWIVKVRPDLLWLEPLPLTFLSVSATVYVPRGVMSRRPTEQRHNDHVFVCPFRCPRCPVPLCGPYFASIAQHYEACRGSLRKEDMLDQAYPGTTLRFIEVAYTVARDDGPQCMRLPCGNSSWHTGCVAPNLVRFHSSCVALAQSWSTGVGQGACVGVR